MARVACRDPRMRSRLPAHSSRCRRRSPSPAWKACAFPVCSWASSSSARPERSGGG